MSIVSAHIHILGADNSLITILGIVLLDGSDGGDIG
jgi:hypothetical protein